MSLYHRFGSKVVVLADCGEHQPPYLRAPGRLLLTMHLPPPDEPASDAFLHFDFAHTLKADQPGEIDMVIDAAPDISLRSILLEAAFIDAE